ncbi:MAG: polyphosphate:AMP phosphotransferase [Acidimicrobiales bacterium]
MTAFDSVETGAKLGKAEYRARLPDLRLGLLNAQFDLRSADFSVVIVIAGNDRIGATAALRTLNELMDARYMKTVALPRVPNHAPKRPLLERYWTSLPRNGQVGLFYGGWPIDAVYNQVLGDHDQVRFDRDIAHSRSFEQILVAEGTLVLKFWLHLPKKMLKKRLKRAVTDPAEFWQITEADWGAFEVYDDSVEAASRYVEATTSPGAEWVMVESSDAHHRDATISETILSKIQPRLQLAAEEVDTGSTVSREPSGSSLAPAPSELLARLDLSASLSKGTYKRRRDSVQAQLNRLTAKAVQHEVSSVLVFEGWDAAGKGGAIRRLTSAVAPQNYRVIPVAAPTPEELAHPYLWRFWERLPSPGRITIFDRSWYGRVLVERVEGLAAPTDWKRAYDEINDFEEQLCEAGIIVLKFWLHIDPDEQLERFEQRGQTAYKKHKLTNEDFRNRERWLDYESAVQDMVDRTNTPYAPWHLIAANDKRWARVAVLSEYESRLRREL